jgi:hypothetical protein
MPNSILISAILKFLACDVRAPAPSPSFLPNCSSLACCSSFISSFHSRRCTLVGCEGSFSFSASCFSFAIRSSCAALASNASFCRSSAVRVVPACKRQRQVHHPQYAPAPHHTHLLHRRALRVHRLRRRADVTAAGPGRDDRRQAVPLFAARAVRPPHFFSSHLHTDKRWVKRRVIMQESATKLRAARLTLSRSASASTCKLPGGITRNSSNTSRIKKSLPPTCKRT